MTLNPLLGAEWQPVVGQSKGVIWVNSAWTPKARIDASCRVIDMPSLSSRLTGCSGESVYTGLFFMLPDRLEAFLPNCACEVGIAEVDIAEVGTAEVGIEEVGFAEVGTGEVGIAEVGKAEVGIAEVDTKFAGDTSEVGTAEVGFAEVGTAEVGIAEVGIYWKLKPAQIARLTPAGIPKPLNMRRVKSTSTPNPDGDHAKDGSLHISFPSKNRQIVRW